MENQSLQEKVATLVEGKKIHTLGHIAQECGVSELEIAQAMPEGMCTVAKLQDFSELWAELATWPVATFIMTHAGNVIEIKGQLPKGKLGHGYFNLGHGLPLSGHLYPESIDSIGFLSLPFMGLESLSVQFFDAQGGVVFGIYVGRENRVLIPEAKDSFLALREKYGK